MDSPSLQAVWEAAKGDPFSPAIGKNSQFLTGFSLLTIGLLLSGLFGLSKQHIEAVCMAGVLLILSDRSFLSIGVLGGPASLAFAYVSLLPTLPA